MATLIGIITPIVFGLLTHEIIAHGPALSRHLIFRASLQIEQKDRERYLAEWLAVLEDLPGTVRKLRFAFDLYLRGAWQTNRALSKPAHPFAYAGVRNTYLAIVLIAINVRSAHVLVPQLIYLIRRRRFRNIQCLFIAQRVILLAGMLSQYRGESKEQQAATMGKAFASLEAVLKRSDSSKIGKSS